MEFKAGKIKFMRFYLLIFVVAISIFCLTTCDNQSGSTPTATMKSQVAAMKKNDLPAIRSNLSRGTLKMFEQAAQFQNITLDEELSNRSRQANNVSQETTIEMRNEQITGDAATLEIKNPITGTWDKIPFVRDDGRWKIALDKFMEDFSKETQEPRN